jgi:hypothetical protein
MLERKAWISAAEFEHLDSNGMEFANEWDEVCRIQSGLLERSYF